MQLTDERDVENKLVVLLEYDKFPFIKVLYLYLWKSYRTYGTGLYKYPGFHGTVFARYGRVRCKVVLPGMILHSFRYGKTMAIHSRTVQQ